MKYVRQRISYKQKAANDFKWAKENIDALEQYAYQDWQFDGRSYSPDSRMEMIVKSYKLYNSQIDQEDLENVFNPTGIDIGQKKDDILPYNKAHNKINALLGELIKRPFNLKAVLASDERAYAVTDIEDKLIKEYIMAMFEKTQMLQQLQQSGLPPEEMQEKAQAIEQQFAEVKTPDQIKKYIADEYLEPREMKANSILDLLIKKEDIIEKKTDSFKHGLLSDEEHCWIGEINGYACLKVLNPLNVFYHKSPEIKYVQDGDYAGTRIKMSLADVFDTYKSLTEKDIEKLEEKYSTIPSEGLGKEMHYNFKHIELRHLEHAASGDIGSYGFTYADMVDVLHVEWRSQRKVGFLTFIDEEGQEQLEIIDESLKIDTTMIPGFISLTYEWIPEIWEGTKIDDSIYVDIRPVPNQRVDLNDPYKQSLRYHGLVYNNMNSRQISIMERMRPFQYLYFIVVHNLKKLIAMDHGKIFPMDSTMLDPKVPLEKTLYYMDQLNIYLYNSLANGDQPGAAHRASGVNNAVDWSNAQQIANYIQILEYIDQQIGEVAGIPRAREGQTTAYEAVTNTQQNIIQSSVVTEVLFDAHTKHWEKVLDSLVNLSIRLFNKKSNMYSYLTTTSKFESIRLKEGEFDNCDFNVFVTDSPKENEIFRQLQGLAQPLLQNDKARFSHIIKLIKQKSSIEELTRDIESFEEYMDQIGQQQAQAEQANAQNNLKMQMQLKEMEMQHELRLKEMEIQGKIAVAEIQAFMGQKDQDIDDNGVPDQLEIEKLRHEDRKLQLEKEKMKQESNEAAKDRQHEKEVQDKDIEGKIKIEKSKPKPKPPAKK